MSVVLPCGLLVLRGRLDLFEPLTWFAFMFLLIFVLRPASDLWRENFIYVGRLISPTFTKMLVAGLLAGTGFVIGYLTPAGRSLAERLPRPPRVEARRLLIWSLIVVGVALGVPPVLRGRAGMAQPGRASSSAETRFACWPSPRVQRHQQVLHRLDLADDPRDPMAAVVRQHAGTGTRLGRIAGWAALASIVAFLVINFPRANGATWSGSSGRCAVYYYLRRNRRPSVLSIVAVALMALTVASAVREVRFSSSRDTGVNPVRWLPWNAVGTLLEGPDTSMAPAFAAEMLVVPSQLGYTYGETTLIQPFVTAVPRQLWHGKPRPPNQEILAAIWTGDPCRYKTQCSTFSPFGESYRDAGLVGVFLFAVLFGIFWRMVWQYYLRHRETVVALVAYSSLLPFMVAWMHGNFILPAAQVAMILAVVVAGRCSAASEPAVPIRPRRIAAANGSRWGVEIRPRWPNLFLVGAAKAGTTSLYAELARHPEIYMSPMKEPHFFSRIEPAAQLGGFFPHVSDEDEYLALFEGAGDEPVVGEASTSYLWDPPRPPSGSREAVPEAKILIVLRDPVERAYSHYRNDVREGMERRSFLEALAAEQRDGPGGWGVSSLYMDCGRYAEQLTRYVDRFGDRVKVLFFEDFVTDEAGRDRGGPLVPGRTADGRGGGRADERRLTAPEQAQRGRARQRQAAQARPGDGAAGSTGQAAIGPAEESRRRRRWTPRRARS